MGTSNWQNIPFCVDVLMKIAPERVLDIGVGFGRWGVIVREFCDVWFDRVLPHEWTVYIEGIEGFEANIVSYHTSFYNKIHIGDARNLLPSMPSGWNVIIFGDVLEHFGRSEAELLLEQALTISDYVLVNIPLGADWPQEDKYNNPYERHLSTWLANDFSKFNLRRQALFQDFLGRPFGSFILSKYDPKNLTESLFSRLTSGTPTHATAFLKGLTPLEMDVLQRMRVLQSELQSTRSRLLEIEQSRGFRLLKRIRRSRIGRPVGRAARILMPETGTALHAIMKRDPRALARVMKRHLTQREMKLKQNTARVRVLEQHSSLSQDSEVWLLAVNPEQVPAVELSQIPRSSTWSIQNNSATPSGQSLVSARQGYIDIAATPGTRLLFMTHPWSGLVQVLWGNQALTCDLYSATTGTTIVRIDPITTQLVEERNTSVTNGHVAIEAPLPVQQPLPTPTAAYVQQDKVWVERVAAQKPKVVAVMHPEWRGIRSSTVELFPHYRLVDDTLDEARGIHEARLLLETGCDRVVISGFPLSYVHLVSALHRLAPKLQIMNIWHGSFMQTNEDYAWQGFQLLEQLCRNDVITKWGFVKQGMAEIMAAQGLNTGFVMNLVRRLPYASSTPLEHGTHIGIWAAAANWRKSPYAMIAATSIIPQAIVHGTNIEPRAQEFAHAMGVQLQLRNAAIPQEQMPHVLSQMHLNMYVTFSECAPMVPLESLSVGTPCLLGPNSYYFEDHDYLYKRLVVPHPDSALMISRYAQQALEERDEIMQAYCEYAPGYNERALAQLETFLELPCRVEVA